MGPQWHSGSPPPPQDLGGGLVKGGLSPIAILGGDWPILGGTVFPGGRGMRVYHVIFFFSFLF